MENKNGERYSDRETDIKKEAGVMSPASFSFSVLLFFLSAF